MALTPLPRSSENPLEVSGQWIKLSTLLNTPMLIDFAIIEPHRWDPTKSLFEQFAASDLSAINSTTEPVSRILPSDISQINLTRSLRILSSNRLNLETLFLLRNSQDKRRSTANHCLSCLSRLASTNATDHSQLPCSREAHSTSSGRRRMQRLER
jgi:hypothetical protein